MDKTDLPAISLASAISQGAKRGWNLPISLQSRRLSCLLICFQGYCLGFISALSMIGAVAGRNPRGNLEGAAITGVIAFALIRVGRSVRRSVLER